MKRDMGGAAAILHAFCAVVRLGVPDIDLTAILCLAENAVGMLARLVLRPPSLFQSQVDLRDLKSSRQSPGRLVSFFFGGGGKNDAHSRPGIAMAAGPKSARPDDIHVLYSGKTVEINNTDAGL
jgi:hypothetical protein